MANLYFLGQRPDIKDTINDGRCFSRDTGAMNTTGQNIFNGTHILNHNLTGGCDDEFCKGDDYGNIIQYKASNRQVNGITQCNGITGFDQVSYNNDTSASPRNYKPSWTIYLLILSLLTGQVLAFDGLRVVARVLGITGFIDNQA